MSSQIVGKIGIKVAPDTTAFNAELKAYLDREEKKLKLEIPLVPKDPTAQSLKDARNAGERKIEETQLKLRIPMQADGDKLYDDAKHKTEEANKKLGTNDKTKLFIPMGIDASALANEIRDAVRKAKAQLSKDDLTLKVNVEFDKEHAKQSWDHLKRELSGDHVDLKADLDKQGKVRSQVAELTRNRYLDIIVRIQKRSLVTAKASLESLFGINLIRKTGLMLDNFVRNLDTYARSFATLALKISTIVSGVLAGASSLVGVGASLGQLGGFTLSLPAAAGAIASFVAVGVAAFKNFGDAVHGNLDALGRLPKEAQGAARALHGTWSEMQKPIQSAFWSQLNGVFEDLVKKVLPEVRLGLIHVGTAAGNMTQQLVRAFTEQGGTGVFGGMFDNLASGIKNANAGVRPFIGSLITLGSTGSQFLPKVGKYVGDAGQQFAAWIDRSERAGKVTLWIDNAGKAAHNLGQSFISIKDTFGGIVDAARAAGAGDLLSLSDRLRAIADTVNGPTFQDGLTNIFKGAHGAIDKVKDGLRDVGGALSTLSPVLSDILVMSGTVVGQVLTRLADVGRSKDFGKGLLDFFSGVKDGVTGFLNNMPQIGEGVSGLGSLMGTIAKNFLPVIGQILGSVSSLFIQIKPAIQDLIPIFATFSSNTIGVLVTALSIVTPMLQAVADVFKSMPGLVQTAMIYFLLLSKLFRGGSFRSPFKQTLADAKAAPTAIGKVKDATNTFSRTAFAGLGTRFMDIVPSARTAARSAMDQFSASRFGRGIAPTAPIIESFKKLPAAMVSAMAPVAKVVTNSLTGATRLRVPLSTQALTSGLAKQMQVAGQLVGGTLTRGITSALTRGLSGTGLASTSVQAARQGLVTPISGAIKAAAPTFAGSLATALRQSYNSPAATRQATAGGTALASSTAAAFQRGLSQSRSAASFLRLTPTSATTLASQLIPPGMSRALSTSLSGSMTAAGRAALTALGRSFSPAPNALNTTALGRISGQNFSGAFMRAALQGAAPAAIAPKIAPTAAQMAALGRAGGKSMVSAINTSVNGIRFNSSVTSALRASTVGARGEMSTLGAVIRTGFQTAMTQAGRAITGAGAGLGAAARGSFGFVRSAAKGAFSFIGGGWGLAFAAGFAIMSNISKETQTAKANADAATTAYRNMAKAAQAAGLQTIDGVDSQAAALSRLQDIQKLTTSQDNGFFGFGNQKTSFSDLMKQNGFSDQDVINVMTGKGSDAAKSFLQGLINTARDNQGIGLTRWLVDWGNTESDNKDFADQLQSVLENAGKAKQELDNLWSTNPGRADGIKAAIKVITDATGNPVTLNNITGIRRGLDGLNDTNRPIQSFASALAISLGGSSKAVDQSYTQIMDSLVSFGTTASEISKHDYLGKIATDQLNAGKSVGQVQKGFEGLGFSADEAATIIKNRYGPALGGLKVNGEIVPKLHEFSSGILEVANAISAATGVDAGKLANIIRLDGVDPVKIASDLGKAGVSMDMIKSVLDSIGVTGPDAVRALDGVASSIRTGVASGIMDPQKLTAFSDAVAAIRDSADGAAAKADALFTALQTLEGNPLDSWHIKSAGQKAIDDATIALQGAKKDVAALTGIDMDKQTGLQLTGDALKAAIDKVKFSSKDLLDFLAGKGPLVDSVGAAFEGLGKNGLTVATDAFKHAKDSGKTSAEAMKIARDSITPFSAAAEDLTKKLGFTDEQAQAIKTTFGLFPDDITLSVLLQDKGATGQLAQIGLKLGALQKGGSFTVDALTKPAEDKLKALGLKITTVDGKSTISFDGDPKLAERKLTDFIATVKDSDPSIFIGATMDGADGTLAHWKGKLGDDMSAIIPVGAATGLANTAVNGFKAGVNTSPPARVPVDAGTAPAISTVAGFVAWSKKQSPKVPVGADVTPAQGSVKWLNVWSGQQHPSISVGAAVKSAQGSVDWLKAWTGRQPASMPVDANTAGARAHAGRMKSDLENTSITMGVKLSLTNQQTFLDSLPKGFTIGGGKNANGNVYPHVYANGGFYNPKMKGFANGTENHVAQISRGTWRVWAEPETEGEAYIPLAASKRARSVSILEDVARRFGYELSRFGGAHRNFDEGAVVASAGESQGNTFHIVNHYPQAEPTSVTTSRAAQLAANIGGI